MNRTEGIGGSDVGAICGVNNYKTPLDVYMEKIGEKDRCIGHIGPKKEVVDNHNDSKNNEDEFDF